MGKAESTILGFQNTYSDTDTDKPFFGRVLYYLGNRHDSEKRYVHATINLPRGEQLNDKDYFELSIAYMKHMGYGEQPYMVVRHHDTKHEHVHIVSTTIREDCLQINLSNDFKRNVATQKYMEKQFGLSPSPDTRQTKELLIYRIPQFKNEDISGVRFYIQDIINNTLQKYKVGSFQELSELLRPYHIQLRTVDHCGRKGVSFGIEVEDGYSSRFINKVLVRKGQTVKQHEMIGTVGSTGSSTGYHLHYEIMKNGNKIDPILSFNLKKNIYSHLIELNRTKDGGE